MNVAFDQFSTQDVAKILGAAPQTVSSWVRKGYIKATNVSDGTEKARYMFTDEEVTRVQGLMKQYGTFKWMRHSKPQAEAVHKPIALPVTQINLIEVEKKQEQNVITVEKKDQAFNANKVMNKILKIQDLKERLENLEAERNQIVNEIEALRKEVMEVI